MKNVFDADNFTGAKKYRDRTRRHVKNPQGFLSLISLTSAFLNLRLIYVALFELKEEAAFVFDIDRIYRRAKYRPKVETNLTLSPRRVPAILPRKFHFLLRGIRTDQR